MKAKRSFQLWRFLIVGALGISVYYTVLYVLTEVFGVWYLFSTIVGFILSYGVNFTLQKLWTFRNKSTEGIFKQVIRYFGMALIFLVINSASMYVLVEYKHLNYLVAQVIMTVILTAASFIVSRKIFANKNPAHVS